MTSSKIRLLAHARRLALAGGIGLAALASAAVSARQAAATPDVRSWHVQGNVWLVHADAVNVAVQVGPDGVLVVDSGTDDLSGRILDEITRLAAGRTLRFILNTSADSDHTGGNATIAKVGRSIISGNFGPQAGTGAANAAKIVAHENVLRRMSTAEGTRAAAPQAALPTDTFFAGRNDLYFNGEAVQMLHQPKAHSDSDVIVYFRKSDVLVTGDVYVNTTFPVIDVAHGGSVTGVVAALNRILEITVPEHNQEGGTYVIPGHGRIADEADVVEYRDMVTIVRDRLQDAMQRGLTPAQVKTTGLLRDYEGRYGASRGSWTTDAFVDAVYRSLGPAQPAAAR